MAFKKGKLSDIKVPAGFSQVTTPKSWDFRQQPVIQGEIVAFGVHTSTKIKDASGNGKRQRNCVISDDDGECTTVWESAGLAPLFLMREHDYVWIAFQGEEDVGKDNKLRHFIVAKKT